MWRPKATPSAITAATDHGPPYPSMGLLRDVYAGAAEVDIAHVLGLFNLPVTGSADAVRRHGAGEVVRRQVDAVARGLNTVLEAGREPYAEATSTLTRAFSWSAAAPRIEAMYRSVLSEVQRARP